MLYLAYHLPALVQHWQEECFGSGSGGTINPFFLSAHFIFLYFPLTTLVYVHLVFSLFFFSRLCIDILYFLFLFQSTTGFHFVWRAVVLKTVPPQNIAYSRIPDFRKTWENWVTVGKWRNILGVEAHPYFSSTGTEGKLSTSLISL